MKCLLPAVMAIVAFAMAHAAEMTDHVIYRGKDPGALLVLVPGINQPGEVFLTDRWKQFADEEGLILLAPTFFVDTRDVHQRRGYYYPELGSGRELEEVIGQIEEREGRKFDKIYLFGFSAGAHFSHRYALWNPRRVAAFVAYSAGWWDAPTWRMRIVPALIMCGEADSRYAVTKAFFDAGQKLGAPWIWRSYVGVGHEVTPQVERMAQAFLKYYIDHPEPPEEMPLVGDAQTYRVFPARERGEVPENLRIALPSQEVAAEWVKE